MTEWTKGYFFGCAITLLLIWMAFHLTGCAHSPYYSGTASQHMIPCDQDNCGRPWWDASGYHK